VLVLNPRCGGVAPIVDLDEKMFKMVQNLEAATLYGYPSLVDCRRLSVVGAVNLSARNVFKGIASLLFM
jgi:UTP--glucose-1-phosphate uridylyltransferase